MRAATLLFIAAICHAAASREPGVAAWIAGQGGTLEHDAAGRVTGVNLRAAWITDSDLARLADFQHLAHLNLSLTHITDLGMEHLAPLAGVTDLDLAYAEHITDEGVAHLKRWKKLARLNLRGTKITDTTLEHLAAIASLTSLDVSFTQITSNGLERLSSLTNLRDVTIGGNKITDSGLEFLKLLSDLERLDLHGRQRTDSGLWSASVTDEGLDAIAGLIHLRELNLAGTRITDLGAAKLAHLESLESLDLSGTLVSSRGIESLAALPKLRRLVLWKAERIDDSAVPYLNRMVRLTWLDVTGTKISDAAKEQMKPAKAR